MFRVDSGHGKWTQKMSFEKEQEVRARNTSRHAKIMKCYPSFLVGRRYRGQYKFLFILIIH